MFSRKPNLKEMLKYFEERNDYDFISIAKGFDDESLVVLAMLLDIPLGGIFYLNSKRLGGYDDGKFRNTCFWIQKPNVTEEMKNYLSSPKWHSNHSKQAREHANRPRRWSRLLRSLGAV